MSGGKRRGLKLGVVELDTEPADLLGEPPARVRGVVGHEPQPVPRVSKPRHRHTAAVDRLAGDMKHAVDV